MLCLAMRISTVVYSFISIVGIAVAADDNTTVIPSNANEDDPPPAGKKGAEEISRAHVNNERKLGCDGPKQWHPVYAAGWKDGYCRYDVDCDTPGYSTELDCCKRAYVNQISGHCMNTLPSPPTMSPTETGGPGIYYPDYVTAWDQATCINKRPVPSGRPIYSNMLACCKSSYRGQMSGKCISMLPNPPTSSPTNSDFEADFWYPMYETAWDQSGC
ncbi:hypothetical protein ACHAXR_001945, partial [Thalassiosira sp. AJA248-18]